MKAAEKRGEQTSDWFEVYVLGGVSMLFAGLFVLAGVGLVVGGVIAGVGRLLGG